MAAPLAIASTSDCPEGFYGRGENEQLAALIELDQLVSCLCAKKLDGIMQVVLIDNRLNFSEISFIDSPPGNFQADVWVAAFDLRQGGNQCMQVLLNINVAHREQKILSP